MLYAIGDTDPRVYARHLIDPSGLDSTAFRAVPNGEGMKGYAAERLRRTLGRTTLFSRAFSRGKRLTPQEDLDTFALNEATDDEIIKVAESYFVAVSYVKEKNPEIGFYVDRAAEEYEGRINGIFTNHNLPYLAVDGRVLSHQSDAMQKLVLEPAITFLRGQPRFAAAEKAFADALDELRQGRPPDAITDVSRALQELLVELGGEGNTVSKAGRTAIKRGLLMSHDKHLLDAVELLFRWIEANRSERGDAHKTTDASQADARLAINIAGAIFVWLAEARTREAPDEH